MADKPLQLVDVMKWHERVAERALSRSADGRASRYSRMDYQVEHEMHKMMADIIRLAIVLKDAP